jgi:hypothetical protein
MRSSPVNSSTVSPSSRYVLTNPSTKTWEEEVRFGLPKRMTSLLRIHLRWTEKNYYCLGTYIHIDARNAAAVLFIRNPASARPISI